MPDGDDDETSAVNRPGGVKALLKQLNNKFGDSHVKLPDGTVPTPKKPFAPRTAVNRAAVREPSQQGGDDGTSPPKGVRAMLQKEVKSSFVKLPDGSTPKVPLVVKKQQVEEKEQLSADDDYEPAPVQADLNLHLQDSEYEAHRWGESDGYENGSRAPPQLLHPAQQYEHAQQARAQRNGPANPTGGWDQQSALPMSDYPQQDQGGRPRGPGPSLPGLSDYPPQSARSVPREQQEPIMRNSGRQQPGPSTTRGPNHGHAPHPGHRGHMGGPPGGGRGHLDGARHTTAEAHLHGDRRVAPGHPDANVHGDRRGPPGRHHGPPHGHNVGGHPPLHDSPPHVPQREQMRAEDVYNKGTYQNGMPLGNGRDAGRETARREIRTREKEQMREREPMAREREPLAREREPTAREREVRVRETAGREPMPREPKKREGIVREPPVQPPAPPALLPGPGLKPAVNARPGYPGGPMPPNPPNPPNLLPVAKTHDYAASQRTSPALAPKSRSPHQQEHPEAFQRQSKVSEWVQSIPSVTKSAPLSPDVAPRDSASPHRVDNMIRRHAPQPDRMPPPGDMQTIRTPVEQRTPRDYAEMAQMGADVTPSAKSVFSSRATSHRCGIGVTFKRLESRSMEVVGLVPGGTGAESGLIFVGDVLRFVDGVDVTKTVGLDFDELLLGEDGSTITLSFGKPGSNTSALVHVAVNRGPDGMSRGSSLSSMPTTVGNMSNRITPLPAPITPAKSTMPRVLVPKVIHANPVNVQQMRSNRSDSVTYSNLDVPQQKLVGVGIVFSVDEWGGLRVKHLIAGGPAAMSQEVTLGDVLYEIDGLDVYQKSVDEIQQVVMGPKDSVVTLGWKNSANMSGPARQVHLFRKFDASAADNTMPPLSAPVSYSKVIEMLYVGDAEISRNIGLVKDLGINCVVNVAIECDNHFEADFTYANYPFEDHPSAILSNAFDDACEVIERHMHRGLTSLVHCSDGNNRSAAFCLAFLMRKKRATLKQAWNLVKNVRPTVNPYPNYLQQLVWYERQVHGANTMTESDLSLDTVVV